MQALAEWLVAQLNQHGGQIIAGVIQGSAIVVGALIAVKAYNRLLGRRHGFEVLMSAASSENFALAMWDLARFSHTN